jgi:hypothetical protein
VTLARWGANVKAGKSRVIDLNAALAAAESQEESRVIGPIA